MLRYGNLFLLVLALATHVQTTPSCYELIHGPKPGAPIQQWQDALVGKEVGFINEDGYVTYDEDPADQGCGEKIKLPKRTRVITPDTFTTAHFIADRLNIQIDDGSVVTGAYYG